MEFNATFICFCHFLIFGYSLTKTEFIQQRAKLDSYIRLKYGLNYHS